MATINLGRIKPVFRGAYAGGTAYVVDDIVTHGNESFICIQAGTGNATSNASYWTKLAAKGADGSDGTDVGTTLTTQGDILYRDGSGLQRLAKGTAGQVLKMNAAANAPEYGTISSDWVKLGKTDLTSVASVSFQDIFTTDYDIYKVFVSNVLPASTNNLYFRFLTSGSTEDSTSNYNSMNDINYRQDSNNSKATALDNYTGASQHKLSNWGAVGNGASWSGLNNWELTLYDPKRNHKSTSAKGGNVNILGGYMYHSTYQVALRGMLWQNQVGASNSYSGIKIYWENAGNFQAVGTISVYGIKA